jgi:hypothetical protein
MLFPTFKQYPHLPQFRSNLLRHLRELRLGQDPLQRCDHRAAVARHGRQLLAVRRHRAGDLKPYAGGLLKAREAKGDEIDWI